MNKRHPHIHMGIGGTSLLAVFAVLCLIAFGALSLATARSDLKLAEKTAASIQAYYLAEAKAETVLASIAAAPGAEKAPDWTAENALTIEKRSGVLFLRYEVPVDGHRVLDYEVELLPSGEILARTGRIALLK